MQTGEPQWSLTDIAELTGLSVHAVESRMRRLALEPDGRRTGRGGAHTWDPARVRAEWSRRGWELPPDADRDPPVD